jgi:trehalose/maltose hydrolase-like predicted phosphorylase
VAWAARRYLDWAGDDAGLAAAARDLIVGGGEYWASRVHLAADDRAHIDHVIGPDEYHEDVDDNAYTNVMARSNLRAAADLTDDGDTAGRWRMLAHALVDGYDPATGVHEQFAGFHQLEPAALDGLDVPSPAADRLPGPVRPQDAQVVKQADVLLLHHLVPDELPPGSAAADLDLYGPITAHGSSLSPAIHASVAARLGRADEARRLLALAARLDLDDQTGSIAGGLHVATMGGLWQALMAGFLGISVRPGGTLSVDPRLPGSWGRVAVRFHYRGTHVGVRVEPDAISLATDAPVTFSVAGGAPVRVDGDRVIARGAISP